MYSRATSLLTEVRNLLETMEEASLRKGSHDLPGGGMVVVRSKVYPKGKLEIAIWPENPDEIPGRAEEDRLLHAASTALKLKLHWEGDWIKSKYAGYYRNAWSAEKVVKGRSRAIGKWLDQELLRVIDEQYKNYEKYGHREPSLTVTFLRMHMGAGPGDWGDLSDKEKTSRVAAALKRLVKKNKLVSSIGPGVGGREARMYEPYWFAKKHGNA
jgi:hypothetical protein